MNLYLKFIVLGSDWWFIYS